MTHYLSDDSLDVLKSGLAGGIAGCTAKTSVAPLDRVKILFQTYSPEYKRYAGTFSGVFRACSHIYKEHGLMGLYQGHSATLLRIFPYAGVKFMAYEKINSILMPTRSSETSLRRFIAGSAAGLTSSFVTYPLELVRVRLAYSSEKVALRHVILEVLQEPTQYPIVGPISNFYRGIWPTLLGIVPYAGTSFLVWGFLRREFLPKYISKNTRSKHRSIIDLTCGGIAGAVGQTASYPLDIVRRQMQVDKKHAGFRTIATQIYRQQGFKGFFVGLSIGYIKVIPTNAVSFLTWVRVKEWLGVKD